MTAGSIVGIQNAYLIDSFWERTQPEERAALHTAFNLVYADHSTDPQDLIECAKSTRSPSSVRGDFVWFLDRNVREDITALDLMKVILKKKKWRPSDEIKS